ncbi:MAG: TIGR04168 family protein, partial [Dolichospermum sp.]
MTSQKTQSKPVKIAVVGDIHDQWDVEDGMAL